MLQLSLVAAMGSGCAPPPQEKRSRSSPVRVVSLTPSLTELMFALQAGDRVVGVTRNDHFPAAVEALPKVGDMQVDGEALLALAPDLVIYDPALNAAQLPGLQRLGVPLEAVPTQNLDQLQAAFLHLGEELGHPDQGRRLSQDLTAALDRARERARGWKHRPRVVAEIWYEPLTVAGAGCPYVNQVLQSAGFEAMLADRPGNPTLDLEELHRLNPEVLLLTHPVLDRLRREPAWRTLPALRDNRVLVVPEDLLVRPGLRVTEAMTLMQNWAEAHLSLGR